MVFLDFLFLFSVFLFYFTFIGLYADLFVLFYLFFFLFSCCYVLWSWLSYLVLPFKFHVLLHLWTSLVPFLFNFGTKFSIASTGRKNPIQRTVLGTTELYRSSFTFEPQFIFYSFQFLYKYTTVAEINVGDVVGSRFIYFLI